MVGLSAVLAQSVAFGHLDIGYDDRVLRPRPWTTAQSQWGAQLMRGVDGPMRVLELCAGAGHIGLLALALAGSPTVPHTLVSVDLSPVACDHARRNAVAAGLGSSVEVRQGGVDAVLGSAELFDLVIADPPWVRRAQTSRFPDDPVLAIDGGPDGLDVARRCIRTSEMHLRPGGSLVLQLGKPEQVHRVQAQLQASESQLTTAETRRFGTHGVLVRLTRGAP